MGARKLRSQLELEEQDHRQAVENTRSCRSHEEDLRHQFEPQQLLLSAHDRELAMIEVKSAAATGFFENAAERREDVAAELEHLWSGLPTAKDQFANDPTAFCETLNKSTDDYRHIDDELAARTQAIGALVDKLKNPRC